MAFFLIFVVLCDIILPKEKSMDAIEKYYNKFNEDKRLLSRHGQVEFAVTMKYIQQCVAGRQGLKILDVGAGTGRYSIALHKQGHQVCALEYVKKNLSVLKQKIINKELTYADICIPADINHTTLWRWFNSKVKPKKKNYNKVIAICKEKGITV